jgi:hypothetical protein
MEGARDDADADLEFEKSRPAVAMIRKKHMWVCECVSVCVSEWVSEWVSECVSAVECGRVTYEAKDIFCFRLLLTDSCWYFVVFWPAVICQMISW